MDRRLGIALAGALGVALFVIAYLLGRQSTAAPPTIVVLTPAPVAPATSGVGGSASSIPAPAPESASASDVARASEIAAASAEVTGAPPLTTSEAVDAPAPPAPASNTESARREVARYFAEVETLQRASKGWSGDVNAVAQEIVNNAANGDTSGMQRLLDANRRLADGLRAVTAPADCAPHLEKTLETLKAADDLLVKMRTAIQAQDVAALAALGAAGQDIERRAKETDALAAEIKSRYGL